jgi:hypothetical protein
MARVARIGDSCTGVCSGHIPPVGFTAVFQQGSSKYSADGIPVVLVGHQGLADCGHQIVATSGSSVVDVDGIPVVRVGDSVAIVGAGGGGTVVSGSPNVNAA